MGLYISIYIYIYIYIYRGLAREQKKCAQGPMFQAAPTAKGVLQVWQSDQLDIGISKGASVYRAESCGCRIWLSLISKDH